MSQQQHSYIFRIRRIESNRDLEAHALSAIPPASQDALRPGGPPFCNTTSHARELLPTAAALADPSLQVLRELAPRNLGWSHIKLWFLPTRVLRTQHTLMHYTIIVIKLYIGSLRWSGI